MDLSTSRLVLHPFTAEEALRVVEQNPNETDRWAPGYPFADELGPLRSFASRVVKGCEPHPFTMYRIDERNSGFAVGGLGFFSVPDGAGTTELGYGLIESARGKGYATEALLRALQIARSSGATRVIADTTIDNAASQRVLLKAGFAETDRHDKTVFYGKSLITKAER